MATIKVNSAVMREKANSFQSVSKSIKSYTDDMIREIESLRSEWEGEAAETTVNKFKGLADNFQEIYDTINQYLEE